MGQIIEEMARTAGAVDCIVTADAGLRGRDKTPAAGAGRGGGGGGGGGGAGDAAGRQRRGRDPRRVDMGRGADPEKVGTGFWGGGSRCLRVPWS
jgi:hypothetical protein